MFLTSLNILDFSYDEKLVVYFLNLVNSISFLFYFELGISLKNNLVNLCISRTIDYLELIVLNFLILFLLYGFNKFFFGICMQSIEILFILLNKSSLVEFFISHYYDYDSDLFIV